MDPVFLDYAATHGCSGAAGEQGRPQPPRRRHPPAQDDSSSVHEDLIRNPTRFESPPSGNPLVGARNRRSDHHAQVSPERILVHDKGLHCSGRGDNTMVGTLDPTMSPPLTGPKQTWAAQRGGAMNQHPVIDTHGKED